MENFNFLPKNVRILILYDMLIKKIKEYGLMVDGMNLGELSFKIYEVMKENVLLEEFKGVNPTAENIAIVIYELLRKKIESKFDLQIRLYETPRNYVEYPI